MTETATEYRPVYAAEQLKKWLRKFDRWMKLCADVREAEQYGEGSLQLEAAVEAWRKGLRNMPSKNSKHQAYSYAYSLVQWLNRHGHNIERGSDVDYLRAVLAAAQTEGLVK